MINTVCWTFDTPKTIDAVMMTKDYETTIIYRECGTVIVTSAKIYVDSEPFVKLIKVCQSPDEARETFLHIVGKMMLKSDKSKYFDAPDLASHMKNGNVKGKKMTRELYDKIIKMATSAVDLYKENFG